MVIRNNFKKSISPDSNSQSIGDGRISGLLNAPAVENRESTPQSAARRNFLTRLSVTTAAAAAVATLPPMQLQAAEKNAFFADAKTRELSLLNIHTLEEIEIVYWEEGKYLDDAVLRLSHHLRDHRENETLMMDPNLLDTLWGVRMITDPKMRFNVISGYRTPKTNEMLRKRSNGVAKFSLKIAPHANRLIQ